MCENFDFNENKHMQYQLMLQKNIFLGASENNTNYLCMVPETKKKDCHLVQLINVALDDRHYL